MIDDQDNRCDPYKVTCHGKIDSHLPGLARHFGHWLCRMDCDGGDADNVERGVDELRFLVPALLAARAGDS